MSKGLNYLVGKRPEAMAGLLKFYGKSVAALDDKTRLLISVATKVIVGTERGLRQYAPQAIQAGASKEELLDAVLMAFPAAGLSKVVDAVHILLDMELLPPLGDQKKTEAMSLDLGAIDDYPIEKLVVRDTSGGTCLVYRVSADAFRVYDGHCPHASGDLAKGRCEGETLECPVHHWRFRLEDGRNEKGRLAGLKGLSAQIRDGRLLVEFPPQASE